MKYRLLAFSLLLAGLFSTSCLKEDYSDCYRTYKLILSYKGDGQIEIFPEKINRVEMYVFDEADACVSSSVLSDSDVAARTTTLPHLKPGDYRIICVGNTHDTGLENLDSRDYSKILFAAEDLLAGQTVSGNDSLYYASVNHTAMDFDPTVAEETVVAEFESSHYDILVEVVNAPDVLCADPVIELVGVSPLTNFNNEAQGQPADYMLDAVISQGNNITAKCNIMRHTNHEDVYLKISSQDGSIIHQVNFAEHISRYSSYINTSLNECLIPFKVEFGDSKFDIKIEVPSWVIENVTPEF